MDDRTIEQVRENEDELIKQLQQKENIIKEVREYIEKTDTFQIIHSTDIIGEKLRDKTKKDLLEILDKGE